MKIDIENLAYLYGEELIKNIKDNITDINKNINYLKKFKIENIEEVFNLYPQIFICSPEEFKTSFNKLVSYLGVDYLEKLEMNMDLWGNLL